MFDVVGLSLRQNISPRAAEPRSSPVDFGSFINPSGRLTCLPRKLRTMTNDRYAFDKRKGSAGENHQNPSLKQKLGSAINSLSKQLFVGEFQLEVLRAISILGHSAYGMEIRDLLQKKQGREVSTPQVYSALTRLSDLGLVKSEIDQTATAGQRGRPRRVYTLKTSGLRMLELGNDLKSMSRKGALSATTPATHEA